MVQGSDYSEKNLKEPGIFSLQSPLISTPKVPTYTPEGIVKRVMPDRVMNKLTVVQQTEQETLQLDKPAQSLDQKRLLSDHVVSSFDKEVKQV